MSKYTYLYGCGRDSNRIFRSFKGVFMAVVRGGGNGSRSVPPKVYVINDMRLYFLRKIGVVFRKRFGRQVFYQMYLGGKCLLGVELFDSGATKMLVGIFLPLWMAYDDPYCTAS